MLPPLSAYLRHGDVVRLCNGQLEYHVWSLDTTGANFGTTAAHAIAFAYLGTTEVWDFPHASVAPAIPDAEHTTRMGDFGEILSAALYGTSLGYEVPFVKLETHKGVGNATAQGPDLLAISMAGRVGKDAQPVVVEVKTRQKATPSDVLKEIRDTLETNTDDYLVSGWFAAARAIRRHPAHRKEFALSAATHLAGLEQTAGTYPRHERHAVVVTGGKPLSEVKVQEHWGPNPPVTQLHVVVVPDIKATVDACYDGAARLDLSSLVSKVPVVLKGQDLQAGLRAPVISDEAMKLARSTASGGLLTIMEGALWYLADWDGMASARARTVAESSSSPLEVALARLLTGGAGQALTAARGFNDIFAFAQAVAGAWALTTSVDDVYRAAEVAATTNDELVNLAIRYVAAAVVYRFDRHPKVLTAAVGADGPTVTHVLDRMLHFGRRAFWPSQAKALEAGLLDRAHPSMAIKMPTSAGKSTLIELLVADTIDANADAVAVVLAPTKALVRQLTSDIHRAFPDTVAVRSSHGGLDFDLESPSSEGLTSAPGAVVLTPERFDLEWRRATSGDASAAIENVQLLVVDEAHLLTESDRGARLELLIGRALKRGIRVVLLSSQLPKVKELSKWINGESIEFDWTPTWLQRYVFFESPDRTVGLLQAETGEAQFVLQLKSGEDVAADCKPSRISEVAALAERYADEGLVVIYDNERRHIDSLTAALAERFPPLEDVPTQLAEHLTELQASDPHFADLLRRGIGVHHAGVSRRVRAAVESAARRNLLRCVVCSPTLLEGVDFPTKTVLAAYPPWSYGKPQIGKLRNLAGRTGRGGFHSFGRLVIFASSPQAVAKWLRAFRQELPPTQTALDAVLAKIVGWGEAAFMNDAGTNALLASIDALVVVAIAEGAVIDGDLRAALEDVLGRTLWYSGVGPAARDRMLQRASIRATYLSNRIGNDRWKLAFYRTGLPLNSCLLLRDAILPGSSAIIDMIESEDRSEHDRLLLWMASKIAPLVPEFAKWAALPSDHLTAAMTLWLKGDSDEVIEAAYPEVWAVVKVGDLDSLLPWVLTAVIDFVVTQADGRISSDEAHRKLAPFRIRYGVPRSDLCELVRAGVDRTEVLDIAADFAKAPVGIQIFGLSEYARQRAGGQLQEPEPF